MRFIGCKENLLGFIETFVKQKDIRGNTFCDLFAGTGSVAKHFKKLGYKIISSDLLYFSYVLQKVYIEQNQYPKFTKLLKHLKYNDLILFKLPKRWTIDEEYQHTSIYRKVPIIEQQSKKYEEWGLNNGFPALITGILIRKHTPELIKFQELWWEELNTFCWRDQISLPYCLVKSKLFNKLLMNPEYDIIRFKLVILLHA